MRQYISYEDYLSRHGQGAPLVTSTVEGQPISKEEETPYPAPEDSPKTKPPMQNACTTAPRQIIERPVRRKTGWVSVIFLLLSFGVAIAAAIIMSNGLNLSYLRGKTATLSLSGHRAFCVQMAVPPTVEEASKIAAEVRVKGGGGYVYVKDGLYLVLASAYETEADCDDVIAKLSLAKTNASKFVVDIPAVSLSVKSDSALREVLEKGYTQLWQVFPDLYAVSRTLDEGTVGFDAARLAIGKIKVRVRERINAFQEVQDSSIASAHVKALLISMESQLDNLFVDIDHDATLSHDIKYAYLKGLHSLVSLSKELS